MVVLSSLMPGRAQARPALSCTGSGMSLAQGALLGSILALTFSKKAAEEMRERLFRLPSGRGDRDVGWNIPRLRPGDGH